MENDDYFHEDYRLVDFYDYVYDHVKFDIPFWLENVKNSRNILELACGSGRITLPMIEQGKQVHAIDYSENMLGLLNSKINKLNDEQKKLIQVDKQDMRNLTIKEKFETVLITSNSLIVI